MALVTMDDMELHQLDIKTAFLQGYLDDDIYIAQPPGYTEGEDGMVCHLIKALYGLKQAPRAWYSRLHQELDSYGFKVSKADPGLYIYNDKTDNIIVSSRDVVFGKGERSKPLQETTHTPDDTLFKFDNGDTQERHPDQDMPAEREEPAERTADDSSNDNEPDTAAPMLRRSERVNKGQRNDTWYMDDGRGSLPVGAGTVEKYAALFSLTCSQQLLLCTAVYCSTLAAHNFARAWPAFMRQQSI
jgi:hypothetical protein